MNKEFKKAIVGVMATAMVFTTMNFAAVTDVQAASVSSIKVLNGKSQTIAAGDSVKTVIKISPGNASKKVIYTSSNKKIAKVTSKGSIKGIKPGKATVTIKAADGSGKKATVKVTVAPAKVKNVKAAATVASDSSVEVTWKKQKNVTGYQILRSTKKNSGYKVVKTVKGASKKSATVTNVPGGTQYFKVRAYKTIGKKKVTGESSASASVKLWKLVWSDEFNASSLNMNNWKYETDADDTNNGWGNQEWQSYTPGQNVEFKDGCLVIVPRITVDTSNNNQVVSASSTRITSSGKKSFTYGKIEIRAKSTKGQGSWSAGWMLGSNIGQVGWPYCGEIDILEAMNAGVPQTIHCPYYNNQSWSHGNKNFNTGLTQAQCASGFHTYGILWTDTYIQFTVDGVNKGYYNPSLYGSNVPYNETWKGVFDHPFHFILNCAIGGNAAGNVSTDGWTLESTNGNLKTYRDEFAIDYVRVYQ